MTNAEVDVYAGSATENAVQALSAGRSNVFSTIKGDDFDSKAALYAATTDSLAIAENLNKPITIANLVVQVIDLVKKDQAGNPVVNPATGEVVTVEVPRTILVDVDGTAYHAVSNGIFKSVENLLGIFGSDVASWGGRVTVKAVREGSGTSQYFTLVPVTAKK